MEFRAEVGVDVERQVEEALDVAVVERLDTDDVRPRLEPTDDVTPVAFSENPATSLPVRGLKAITWAPSTPVPLFVTRR